MLEIIKVIALLCQISSSATASVESTQLSCQKWYINCIEKQVEAKPLADWQENYLKFCIKTKGL